MNIKRSIRIAIENRKKDGVPVVENVPIRLQVFFCGKRIDFTTGYRIDAAKWDSAKQRVKNNVTNKQKQSALQINTAQCKTPVAHKISSKKFSKSEYEEWYISDTTKLSPERFDFRIERFCGGIS